MLENIAQQNQGEENLTRINQVIETFSNARDLSNFDYNTLIKATSVGIGLIFSNLYCNAKHSSVYIPNHSPKDFNATLSGELRQNCYEQQFVNATGGFLLLVLAGQGLRAVYNSSRRQDPSTNIEFPQTNRPRENMR